MNWRAISKDEDVVETASTGGDSSANGAPPAIGNVQHKPLLADTLEAIALDSRDAFYRGAVANDKVDYLQGDYLTPISIIYWGRLLSGSDRRCDRFHAAFLIGFFESERG